MMLVMDPPQHERMRKLVNRAFTPRRIAAWEPVVQDVIGGLLDELGPTAGEVPVGSGGGHPDARREPVEPDGRLSALARRGHAGIDERRPQVAVVVALLDRHPPTLC